MLDESKKDILKENYLLKKRKDAHKKTVFTAIKHHCFLLGVLFGFFILVALYFVSDYSDIYHISVEGNIYLSDSDIIELSGISEDDKYLLLMSTAVSSKLEKSPYIDEAKVERLENRLVRITVKEVKQIGYLFEDNESLILLQTGDRVPLNEDNAYLLKNIPLLEGYNKDQITEILRGFKQIEAKTINEISEIHRYPFSYDENMMEVIMRDGNYCFVSWTGLKMLEEYYSIESGIDKSNGLSCIYLDELTNSGFISVCPWQNVPVVDEVGTEASE
ncbi:MAG: FtsQ-type POTRA domain-containing protein [Erysipelotrichaceae bacterium]|nr:FtsQ-type POTRA domain-containing protein [Erysipelotrichaceae bacterium]